MLLSDFHFAQVFLSRTVTSVRMLILSDRRSFRILQQNSALSCQCTSHCLHSVTSDTSKHDSLFLVKSVQCATMCHSKSLVKKSVCLPVCVCSSSNMRSSKNTAKTIVKK